MKRTFLLAEFLSFPRIINYEPFRLCAVRIRAEFWSWTKKKSSELKVWNRSEVKLRWPWVLFVVSASNQVAQRICGRLKLYQIMIKSTVSNRLNVTVFFFFFFFQNMNRLFLWRAILVFLFYPVMKGCSSMTSNRQWCFLGGCFFCIWFICRALSCAAVHHSKKKLCNFEHLSQLIEAKVSALLFLHQHFFMNKDGNELLLGYRQETFMWALQIK